MVVEAKQKIKSININTVNWHFYLLTAVALNREVQQVYS